jgi:hypothetical protein
MQGDADLARLSELAAKLRTAQDRVAAETAKEAAPEIEKIARATAAAGTTPDGTPWAPTKKGKRALVNAAAAISAVAGGLVGDVIVLVLRGPEVFHHLGKGSPVRQILPSRKTGIPAPMKEAIRGAAGRAIRRVLGGRA